MKDVAQEAGVSTAVVSYVINNSKFVAPDKVKRVRDAVARLGYQPNSIARNLRQSNTKTIGILVEDITGFSVPPIICGISEYMEEHGYHIVLSDLHLLESIYNKYDQIVQQKAKINAAINYLLHGVQVEAVIYVGLFDREITGIIEEIAKPLVLAYATTADQGAYDVTYDSTAISAEAIRYLLSKGHRQLAVITGPVDSYPVKMRMAGVKQALQEAGIELHENGVKVGDWEFKSGYISMTEILAHNLRPTAVFAMNDYMAAGALNAIQDAGLNVPDDLSIIGFDNREISLYLKPKLTTVEINLKEIGRTAAEMSVRLAEGETIAHRNIVIPSKLVERETVQRLDSLSNK